jgi:hypothetical protein
MTEGDEEVKLYKVLDGEGRSCNGGDASWSLPKKREDGTWQPGEWMDGIEGELVPCGNGYHLCRPKDLIYWLGEKIHEAEYEGELKEDETKVVVRRCRLLKSCENWTKETARAFACWCVRNTPLSDDQTVWALLTDDRSKKAVETVERYAKGEATEEELRLARAAAGDAAWTAAGDAAWDAARAVAGDAPWDAAWAAPRAAAWDVQTKELMRILNTK